MIQVKNLQIGTGRPKVCAPLTGVTQEKILSEARLSREAGADLVEWRVDFYQEILQLEKVLETLVLLRHELQGLPLLFTFRTLAEGGKQDLSIREYHDLYETVVTEQLVDMVDIELFQIESLGRGMIERIKDHQIPIIISNHEFKETPSDPVLLYRLNMMEHFGASIGKLAMMPQTEQDVFRLLELTKRASAFVSIPLITVSMGEMGKLSRVAGCLTGSAVTFGAISKASASAPGQLSVKELQQIIKSLA